MRALVLTLVVLSAALPVRAQEALGLNAPDEMVQSGFLKYLLPRFSLKTGVRVQPAADGEMVLSASEPGKPVFRAGETIYYLNTQDDPRQARFLDWMTSDIGKRTIDSYQVDGTSPYTTSFEVAVVDAAPNFEGDTDTGEKLALTHCGRCHVVSPKNRQNGIGSTPSFAVLRAFQDWSDRFQQFYVLKPHAAFTQIEDVTAPFDPERPSPIVPIEMTLDDLDAILSFVEATEAADLGRPIQFQ